MWLPYSAFVTIFELCGHLSYVIVKLFERINSENAAFATCECDRVQYEAQDKIADGN